MEQRDNKKRADNNIWKIALSLVCIGILGYGFFFSNNTTANLAYLIGYNLPLALIIWGIFYATVARKHSAKIGSFSFIAIFICMIGSGLIGYLQQKHEAKIAISEVQNQYSKMLESSIDSQGMPKRIDKHIDTNPQARGELGEFERFMKEFMNQIAFLRNDYLLELEAIGWNSILDPKRIRDDTGLVESRVTIKKAKYIVAKYRKKTNLLLENAREKLQSLDMSASLKQKAISGFDRGMEQTKSEIDSMWTMEENVVIEFENIFELLAARKDAWVVQESKILFYSDTDLNKFNSHIASIQNIVNQQQLIQKQRKETVDNNFTRILKDIE